jgi:hypothetical protein
MAFVTPTNVTVGSVLTASKYNQEVVDNVLAGLPSFTNEAARDAVITSPQEGMVAYLTAPTVPAAAGGSTAVPTGVTTIYNGSVWVCITPVGSRTDNTGTTTSVSYTGTLSGSPGTNPSVTLVTGTSAFVSFTNNISIGTGGQVALTSVAVSGATTLAASDNYDVETGLTGAIPLTRTFALTGLTAGTNTFTLNYRATGGATASYFRRNIVVSGIA